MDRLIENNLITIRNFDLSNWNSLKLTSSCSHIYFPLNKNGIIEIFRNRDTSNKKIIILGKGSNILLTQKYYDDSFIFINLSFISNIYFENDFCTVEAGVTLNQFVWSSLEKGYINNEYLEDIPGTLGGAIIMNAGTYKDYIGDVVHEIEYFDIDNQKFTVHKINKNDFSKRKSFLTSKSAIIVSAKLRLTKGNVFDSIIKISNIKADRFKKQPRDYPNAGSVFVRPDVSLNNKVVWQIIEDVGLRGFKINDAMISDKHPGFIINTGDATAEDILKIIEIIKLKVKNSYKIDLKLEWKLI